MTAGALMLDIRALSNSYGGTEQAMKIFIDKRKKVQVLNQGVMCL